MSSGQALPAFFAFTRNGTASPSYQMKFTSDSSESMDVVW